MVTNEIYEDKICSNYVSALIESLKSDHCATGSFKQYGCYECTGLDKFKTCDCYFPVDSFDVIEYIGQNRFNRIDSKTKQNLERILEETKSFKMKNGTVVSED